MDVGLNTWISVRHIWRWLGVDKKPGRIVPAKYENCLTGAAYLRYIFLCVTRSRSGTKEETHKYILTYSFYEWWNLNINLPGFTQNSSKFALFPEFKILFLVTKPSKACNSAITAASFKEWQEGQDVRARGLSCWPTTHFSCAAVPFSCLSFICHHVLHDWCLGEPRLFYVCKVNQNS